MISHNLRTVEIEKTLIGWVLRNLIKKEETLVITLFKLFVLSR